MFMFSPLLEDMNLPFVCPSCFPTEDLKIVYERGHSHLLAHILDSDQQRDLRIAYEDRKALEAAQDLDNTPPEDVQACLDIAEDPDASYFSPEQVWRAQVELAENRWLREYNDKTTQTWAPWSDGK